jgi:D-glucosaminate-6-phosphate ammonia-lyase
VGKEEIVGLIVALKGFLARDHAAERREQAARLTAVVESLAGLPGVRAALLDDAHAPRPYPTAAIYLDEAILGRSAEAIVNDLIDGEPRVAVSQNLLHDRALALYAIALRDEEEVALARRLRTVLGARG